MGGNARKRRIIAANRNAAKEKAELKKNGPSTKISDKDIKERNIKSEKKEKQTIKQQKSSWTGKSPLDLLHEHLQKIKWAKARWNEQPVSQDIRGKPLYTWKLSLYNPKTEERFYFRTCVFTDTLNANDISDQTWNSKIASRNNTALSALLYFFPTQSLHLHIAPEYRSTWLYLKDKQKEKQEIQKVREEKKEERIKRDKFFDTIEKRNELTRMQISMTEKTRNLCNDIFIKSLKNKKTNTKQDNIPIHKQVITYLKNLGFTYDNINLCKQYITLYKNQNIEEQKEILFEALILYLPENQLPIKFKPSHGNFEVINTFNNTKSMLNDNNNDKIQDFNLLSEDSKLFIKCIEQFGFSCSQVLSYINTSNINNMQLNNVIDTAYNLYKQICLCNININDINKDNNNNNDILLLQNEEEETLLSMYDNEFTKDKLTFSSNHINIWRLPLSFEDNSKGTLIIYFKQDNIYPYSLPWIQIVSPHLNIKKSQEFIQFLFFKYNDPTDNTPISINTFPSILEYLKGSPMIYSIIMWIEQYYIIIKSLSIPIEISKNNNHTSSNTKNKSNKIQKYNYKQQNNQSLEYKQYLKKPLTLSQLEKLSNEILQREQTNKQTKQYKKTSSIRKKLPSSNFKSKIIELYESNDIIVISGETGCGKTTQIPQFLLEHYIDNNKGSLCNMICTQPRRLSAIGVANRVAYERNENMEDKTCLVGYQVRLQKQISESCRLVFCTVGILLRRLQQLVQASQENKSKRNFMNEYLSSLSCIIIDEVHERSLDCDFLLILLKQYILYSTKGKNTLKIILMSATISTETFISYFKEKSVRVGSFHIPGFTYPVKQYFLPNIFKLLNYSIPSSSKKRLKKQQHEQLVEELKNELPNESDDIIQNLCMFNTRNIDYKLIEQLIIYLINNECYTKDNNTVIGSILIFLPGLAEISKLKDIILGSIISTKCLIISLHSSIPLEKQQIVFNNPPNGIVKIVLSTNIAETSITIPDVIFVIDTGKVKQMQYDSSTQISTLQETFISKSSANQRSGRAGRVQEGQCFKLYTESFYHKQMNDFDIPEIFRVPLHQVYLLTCIFLVSKNNIIDPLKVNKFLESAIQSPSIQQLNEAQQYLININALRYHNTNNHLILTPLGCHISKLPLDVRMAKLLIYSTILRCVDPILTICAVLSYQSPLLSPIDARDEAKEAQQKFKKCKSDHISYYYAYEGFLKAKKNNNTFQFCKENYISLSTMYMIGKLRKQFAELLADIGFISYNKKTGKINTNTLVNEQQYNVKIIQACLCAGLYPNIIKIQPPIKKYTKIAEGGTIEKSTKVQELRFYKYDKKRVFLHPSSFNFSEGTYESNWLVYLKIMETSRLFVHDITMVYPYPLLLFGSNNIHIDYNKGYIIVDNWMYFEADIRIAIIIRKLRDELDKLLEYHIKEPCFELDNPLFSLIIKIIQYDGLI